MRATIIAVTALVLVTSGYVATLHMWLAESNARADENDRLAKHWEAQNERLVEHAKTQEEEANKWKRKAEEGDRWKQQRVTEMRRSLEDALKQFQELKPLQEREDP